MARLGDVCIVVSGTTPKSTQPEYWDGDLNWITPAELTEEADVICESRRKITRQAVVDNCLKPFPAGTVLLSSRAPIGKVAIAGTDMYCNQGFKNLVCSEKICNRYLYHFLKSKTDYLNSLGRGATFKEISKGIVEEIEIPLPPLAEQHEIAAMLDKVSGLAAKRRRQLEKLEELVKARFIEMFGDCIVNPKRWKTKCLDEIAEVGSSKRVFVEELQGSGIPFYRGTEIGSLAEGKPIVPELFITERHYKELCEAAGTPQPGDLLMPSICPDGRIWVVNTEKPFYFKDGRVLWVHAIDNSYDPVFLRYALKDRITTDYNSIASGTTFAELKIFALKKCRIFAAPKARQNQFAAFVEQTDNAKSAIQKSLQALETLFFFVAPPPPRAPPPPPPPPPRPVLILSAARQAHCAPPCKAFRQRRAEKLRIVPQRCRKRFLRQMGAEQGKSLRRPNRPRSRRRWG